MADLIALNAGPKAPSGLSAELRSLADAIDRGEVTSVVAAYVNGGHFDFVYGASLSSGLELATLLQHRCIERFKL
jgi:hypothetical protein